MAAIVNTTNLVCLCVFRLEVHWFGVRLFWLTHALPGGVTSVVGVHGSRSSPLSWLVAEDGGCVVWRVFWRVISYLVLVQ